MNHYNHRRHAKKKKQGLIVNRRDAVNYLMSKGLKHVATGIRHHPISNSPCYRVWLVREDVPHGGPFGSGSGKSLVQAVRSFRLGVSRGEF